ncbi:MAG TPA: KpsF/GutQ family sugar-phosphate isomerase [candidate division Zixibacteria bacterium]|nr:KpsF/GutQ family sugar-phosphate isomerase [candidate division Zixibacteria bacterium]
MSKYKKQAKDVILLEAEAVKAMADNLDENFDRAVDSILLCKGRVIVAGMGKSGLIGKKIVATFNSTGISSFFLHPAEAMHGDLGLMRDDDILMLISKSGRLGEMEQLISTARRLAVPIVVLCGTVDSELYQRADMPLDCSVNREACPNNLVPTSSSTAALVMGDALAVALLQARNFSAEDFAAFHPGGSLGRRLLTKVSDVHHDGGEIPIVKQDASMNDMILQMTSKRLGCVVTIDDSGKLLGIFTDGDLRRLAEKSDSFYKLKASDVMIQNPKTVDVEALLDRALQMMEKYSISQLPTVDATGKLYGIVHLHDILKSKLV